MPVLAQPQDAAAQDDAAPVQEDSASGQQLLREAQTLASRALAAYERHYPDRPLWSQAIAAAERAHEAAPDDLATNRLLGEIYSRTGWWVRAWNAWTRYRELGGTVDAAARDLFRAAAEGMGAAVSARGRPEEALAYYREALDAGSESIPVLRDVARILMDLGRPGEAVPHLETLARHDPSYAAVLDRARDQAAYGVAVANAAHDGIELYGQGAVRAALQRFREAVRARPDYARALRWAARSAEEVGELSEARTYWSNLLRLGVGGAQAEAAVERLDERIAWGDEALAAYREGVALANEGRLAEAEAAFERAVAANPSRPEPYAELGRIALADDRPAEAVDMFQRANALDAGAYADDLAQARQLAREREQQREQELAVAAAARDEAEPTQDAPEPPEETAAAPAPDPTPPAEPEPPEETEAAEPAPEPAPEPEPQPTEEAAAEAPEGRGAESEARPEPAAAAAPAPENPPAPQPEPFTLISAAHEHRGTFGEGDRAFWRFRPAGQNALALAGGEAVLIHRLEVTSKPSTNPIQYQLCLVQDEQFDGLPTDMACTDDATLDFHLAGAYDASQPLTDMEVHGDFRWDEPIHWGLVILRDRDGVPVDDRFGFANQWYGSPIFALYYPMDVEYEVALRPLP